MRTLDDLRRSFEQHADLAGDPRGLVQAARESAVRIRRRRRMARAGVSAAVVAVLAVTVPVVVHRNLAERPVPAAPPSPAPPVSPADRRFGQVTIDLDPAVGYHVEDVQIGTTRQEMTAASARPLTAEDIDPGVRVVVYDPGTHKPVSLPGTEPMTIAGRAAWFQPEYPIGGLGGFPPSDARGAAVGWADPSGAQVVIFRLPERVIRKAMLLEVAQGLRIGPPRDVTLPFQLGWVPAGLAITEITVRPNREGSIVTLRRGDVGVNLWALPTYRTTRGHDGPEFTALTVAGRPAVAYEDDKRRSITIPEFGTCGLMIETIDQKQTRKAELIRVLETLTVADCENKATWIRPAR